MAKRVEYTVHSDRPLTADEMAAKIRAGEWDSRQEVGDNGQWSMTVNCEMDFDPDGLDFLRKLASE